MQKIKNIFSHTTTKRVGLMALLLLGCAIGFASFYQPTNTQIYSTTISSPVATSSLDYDFQSTSSMLSSGNSSSRGRTSGGWSDPSGSGWWNDTQTWNDPNSTEDPQGAPIGSAWILLVFAAAYAAYGALRMRRRSDKYV